MSGKRANSVDPATWATLEQALLAQSKYNYSGVGFVFTEEAGIVGIDIDHCLQDDQLNETATAILSKLPPTYIEISPSGTGLHIFLRGTLPTGGNRNSKTGVEIYAKARYFTMTRQRFRDAPLAIAEDNGALEYILDNFIRPKKKAAAKSRSGPPANLSDDSLLDLANKSRDAARFSALWRGDWQGDFPSQSEADFALCRKLAFWSGRDEGQIDRLFRQSGLFRAKWDERHNAAGESYGAQTVRRACAATVNCYAPKPKPVEELADTGIFEHNGVYYRAKGDKCRLLTNFVVRPVEMIEAEDESQLTCDFINNRGQKYRKTLMTTDFSNLRTFKTVLAKGTIALSYLGSESELELLKIYLCDLDWVTKRGVKALGIYERQKRLVFVTPTSSVSAGGEPVEDILQLERFVEIKSDILRRPLIDRAGLQQLGQWLMRYNEPAKTVPILTWCAACFIKPHLKNCDIKFPHLFLIGEAGSGKSYTLEHILLPIFSHRDVLAASQVSAFAVMKLGASSNVIPMAIDEFKPSTLDKFRLNILHNHFRDSYDLHEGVRGRAYQTLVTYDLLAPIIVAGEESADESAIRERSIELLFSKNDLKNPVHEAMAATLGDNSALLGRFGRSLLDQALRVDLQTVRGWYDEGTAQIMAKLPTRIKSNLCCCYAGLCLLSRVCAACGLPWDAVFPHSPEECTQHFVHAAREFLLDGGNHNRSVVEQTFEVMARMKLAEGKDYAFENGGQYLCLCLSSVYDRYTRYRKDCAVLGEVLTYAQFKKQLERCEFFLEKNRTKRFGAETKRVWVVDFPLLSTLCDVSGFQQQAQADDAALLLNL